MISASQLFLQSKQAKQVNCMTTDSQAAAKRAFQHDSALHFAGFLNARAGRIAAGLAGVPDHEFG